MRTRLWLSLPLLAAVSFMLGATLTSRSEHTTCAPCTDPSALAPLGAQTGATANTTTQALAALPALPSAAAMESWSREQLQVRYRELAATLSAQTAELQRLRQSQATAAACPSAEPLNSGQNALKRRFYPPTQEELESLAKSCSVRVDEPPMLDSAPHALGEKDKFENARPEERAAMNRVLAALHREFRDDLRRIYEEALGHAPTSELGPRTLLAEISDKSDPGERGRVLSAIARERAQPSAAGPAGPTSPYERAQREFLGLGDEFQRRLAEELSPERAHALRAENGGWPWQRSLYTGCE